MPSDNPGSRTSGSSALRLVGNAAEVDPLETWAAAMPRELLFHTRLTGDARVLGSYLWASAGWQPGQIVWTSYAALTEALGIADSTVRGVIARLESEAFLAIDRSQPGRPQYGGGTAIIVYGPASLKSGPRINRPNDTGQTQLALESTEELRANCLQTATEINEILGGRELHPDREIKPHSAYAWLVVTGALLACGVRLSVFRADGSMFGPIGVDRDTVLSAARDAARRADGSDGCGVGTTYYSHMGERLCRAAGEKVRHPAKATVRAACEQIGWRWRPTWVHSPRDILKQYKAAVAKGETRSQKEWTIARDEELARAYGRP